MFKKKLFQSNPCSNILSVIGNLSHRKLKKVEPLAAAAAAAPPRLCYCRSKDKLKFPLQRSAAAIDELQALVILIVVIRTTNWESSISTLLPTWADHTFPPSV